MKFVLFLTILAIIHLKTVNSHVTGTYMRHNPYEEGYVSRLNKAAAQHAQHIAASSSSYNNNDYQPNAVPIYYDTNANNNNNDADDDVYNDSSNNNNDQANVGFVVAPIPKRPLAYPNLLSSPYDDRTLFFIRNLQGRAAAARGPKDNNAVVLFDSPDYLPYGGSNYLNYLYYYNV